MPIVADLHDLALSELLAILSATSKSGRLSVVHGNQKLLVALREGSIIYAASPGVRERIGSVLVNRGLISQGDLNTALQIQRSVPDAPLLGSILIDMGSLRREALHDVIQDQFDSLLREAFSWEDGVAVFERMELADLGEIRVDPANLLVRIGGDPEGLLGEGVARLQEGQPVVVTEVDAPAAAAPRAAIADDAGLPGRTPIALGPAGGGRHSVRALASEVQDLSVSVTAEMTLALLGAAAEVAERAVLLLVGRGCLTGIGGFGRRGDGGQVTGRRLRIPNTSRSVFQTVIAGAATYRGPAGAGDGDRLLADELGGVPPGEVVAAPLVVRGEAVAVLYLDGGPEGAAVEAAAPVEAAIAEVVARLAADRRPSRAATRLEAREARLTEH